ncbi:MAG: hypothetical protein AB1646_26060 [Thermodesulfobacteriota bacterium]
MVQAAHSHKRGHPVCASLDRCRSLLLVNALVLAAFLLWHVSHGFSVGGILDGFYELQANSLSHGHLDIIPGPQEMYCHDILIYGGKYYFYQGLLPSILLWGSSQVLGRTLAHYLITYAFFFLFVFSVQRILSKLTSPHANGIAGGNGGSSEHDRGRTQNPAVLSERSLAVSVEVPSNSRETGKMPIPPGESHESSWQGVRDLLPALLLVWVLILVLPFRFEKHYFEERWFFARFVIYEQQIFFGLAVATAGVFHLIRGIGQRCGRDLMWAGVLFALAAWIRVTWFPFAALALPVMVSLWWKWTPPDQRAFRLGNGFLLGVLAGTLLAGLLFLNYIRFGSPFDFGLQHISMGNYGYQRDVKQYFSVATKFWNFWYNMALYYVSPDLMERLGMTRLAYAQTIGYAPALLWNNPQFAAMLMLVPWAMVRAYRRFRESHGVPRQPSGEVPLRSIANGPPAASGSRMPQEFSAKGAGGIDAHLTTGEFDNSGSYPPPPTPSHEGRGILKSFPLSGKGKVRGQDVKATQALKSAPTGFHANLFAGLAVLLLVVVYFNVLLGAVSSVVVLRYFMDSYYFLMLLCVAALSAFMRPVYVLVIMVAALSWHIPGTVESFGAVRPELRTVRTDSGFPIREQEGPTWFMEPNPKWPKGSFSVDQIDLMTRYNAVGIEGEIDGNLFSKDCFAVYLRPGTPEQARPYGHLTIRGLRALRTPGSLHLFFEQKPVAQLPVTPGSSINGQIRLPYRLSGDAPYQILGLFVPQGHSHLTPRPPGEPVIHFRELRLEQSVSQPCLMPKRLQGGSLPDERFLPFLAKSGATPQEEFPPRPLLCYPTQQNVMSMSTAPFIDPATVCRETEEIFADPEVRSETCKTTE